MDLAVPYPLEPMEAQTAATIPEGADWQYEPKWDGFRCLAFRDGDQIELQSKAMKPLTRYFPEAAEALRALGAKRFVLDGELVVPQGSALDFDALLQRIHPAESRVRRLAAETPARLIVFDLLLDERNRPLTEEPLSARRAWLEKFAGRYFQPGGPIALSPATADLDVAKSWAARAAGTLDGLIAKRLDQPYRSGERDAMVKIKFMRTADCVVGGFRYGVRGGIAGSLLLGLYDEAGLLHHVGHVATAGALGTRELTERLEALREPPGFTGRAPGGPSRWAQGRSTEWEPLRPELVAEVEFDHMTGDRFRHGTRFLRWRPDKPPRKCTLAQVRRESGSALLLL